MNQAILFNDDASFNATQQRIEFTAMNSGLIIRCCVAFEGEEVTALAHFAKHQFDYEMQAEELIEEESYSAEGEVLLSRV
ncbi:MAG: DUF1488 family protein [Pseudomonadota bacterium]